VVYESFVEVCDFLPLFFLAAAVFLVLVFLPFLASILACFAFALSAFFFAAAAFFAAFFFSFSES